MAMDQLQQYHETYRSGLLDDVVPFWLRHGADRQNGGVFTALDRAGSVFDTDKSVWAQGRFAWVLSTIYRTVDRRQEWIDAAKSTLDFVRAHCFDSDGRMFFRVTADGDPVRKRRYLFSECFAVAGLAAYSRATGDGESAEQALKLFKRIVHYYTTPGSLPPKMIPETRASRSIAMPMILLSIAAELEEATGDPIARRWVDRAIDEILTYHIRRDPFSVLETVGPNGEFQDHFEGRLITPGHVIEAAWFILEESRRRGNDAALTSTACEIIDWSWDLGWDEEHGGIIYYRDVKGLPPTEYWHDMKFWWPQNEAIIATLLAYHMTGDEKYAARHAQIHEWTYERFPDPEYGEWFGYLHRDGTVSTTLKGNLWKGPYHVPRMLWYCSRLTAEMLAGR
jgi:N-acylglucosamine 2-epimerase